MGAAQQAVIEIVLLTTTVAWWGMVRYDDGYCTVVWMLGGLTRQLVSAAINGGWLDGRRFEIQDYWTRLVA